MSEPGPSPSLDSLDPSHRAEVHKVLHLQREKKIDELQKKLAENEELVREVSEEKAREEERRQIEIQRTKALAERYKEERGRYLEAQREAQRVREEEELREKKLQQELVKPKIAQREELRLQKLEELRRKEVPGSASLLVLPPSLSLSLSLPP
jgi:hypothetical protein